MNSVILRIAKSLLLWQQRYVKNVQLVHLLVGLLNQLSIIQGGATPRELLIEACRRNNTDLLEEVILDLQKSAFCGIAPENAVAETLNSTQDGIGNGLLHIAAANGNCQ